MASKNKIARPLDKIDKSILRELQKEGRIAYAQLAKKVGLSPTPCVDRVKRLEADGVIQGYSATINPAAVGASLVVFVQIRLSRSSKDVFEEFSKAADLLPEIQECHLVSGSFDYLIKARVADMGSYREFYGDTLLTLPGVQECTSYVVMDQVKETLKVAIP
jgi:Lrp/AsnC family leucine-responsive transcriptional regulator